ncbi:hypothetical protein QBC45DRAFT_435195 [Copromyces sp. CBS 386.78]|nr:hypothetical protein QBC45DRAFT_435195 [Copromyces sp. CBS 386.78]
MPAPPTSFQTVGGFGHGLSVSHSALGSEAWVHDGMTAQTRKGQGGLRFLILPVGVVSLLVSAFSGVPPAGLSWLSSPKCKYYRPREGDQSVKEVQKALRSKLKANAKEQVGDGLDESWHAKPSGRTGTSPSHYRASPDPVRHRLHEQTSN